MTFEEGVNFTDCKHYNNNIETPEGNLINQQTNWNITGNLIRKISLEADEVQCTSRTLLIPVRYRTAQDAMGVCEELGETGKLCKSLFMLKI